MVKVYSINECSWCKKTKSYLAQKGISYTEVNVEDDLVGLKELVRISGQQSVPVLDIDEYLQLK